MRRDTKFKVFVEKSERERERGRESGRGRERERNSFNTVSKQGSK